jgi:hypothetical protein
MTAATLIFEADLIIPYHATYMPFVFVSLKRVNVHSA